MADRGDYEGDEAGRCGGCGSRNMVMASGGKHAGCMDCGRIQEPETRDWPEARMCDNCAFRKGSPERADPFRWAEVSETITSGQYFHCHKGLPAKLDADSLSVSISPPDPTQGRVTVCAGWLAARIAHCKKIKAAE
ncbi:hypothetical protein [Roseicitreum antarcticum]|uniref:Uncharacterized protein n=1 Tax=Roseicitreum antarcticum TaxID=564137 RepID=A0A1H3EWP5_9RHOB|nr:hypothetical protein [Roseicitreum antarcticum]SDX82508.1 hypothetical protein SAMN04488238_1273 [Roseicitreum antarcticum]